VLFRWSSGILLHQPIYLYANAINAGIVLPSKLLEGATSVTVYTTENYGQRRVFQLKTPSEASDTDQLPSGAVAVMNWDSFGVQGTHTYSITMHDVETYPYIYIQGWRWSDGSHADVSGVFTFN